MNEQAKRVLNLMHAIREVTNGEPDFGILHGAILGCSADAWLDAGCTPQGWLEACMLVMDAAEKKCTEDKARSRMN